MKFRWCILGAAALLAACGGKKEGPKSAEDARQRRDTEIVLEKCDVTSSDAKKVDANGDGRAEMVQVLKGDREICRTADLNFDGKNDRTTFYDESGEVRKVESDFDKDGIVDEIALFEAGELREKQRATTLDGRLDTWDFFDKGLVARTERDENGDGVIDQWWEYPSRGCPLIHVDTDGDGRPDPGASIDYCKETGYAPPPLPEAEQPKEEGFGPPDQRVEEVSNVQDGTAEASDSTGDGAAAEASPASEDAGDGADDSTGDEVQD